MRFKAVQQILKRSLRAVFCKAEATPTAVEQYIDEFDRDRIQIGSEPDQNKLLTA
jgi:hypothetical protein